MIGRALDTLRQVVGEPAERPSRPNELRRDAARAERLRRETLRVEPAADRPRRPPEERREPGGPEIPGRGGRPDEDARPLAALTSRSGLRQAWLLTEILGPPRALRGPYGRNTGA